MFEMRLHADPTPSAQLGFVGWRAQLMTVPPNVFAFVVIVANAIWSDQRKERVLHTLGGLAILATGYLLLAVTTALPARLIGVFFIACTNAAVIPLLAYRTATITGTSGTAVATGFAFAIAQLSGVSAPFLFPSQQGPRYIMGNWTIFGMQLLAAVIVLVLRSRLGASACMLQPKGRPAREEEMQHEMELSACDEAHSRADNEEHNGREKDAIEVAPQKPETRA